MPGCLKESEFRGMRELLKAAGIAAILIVSIVGVFLLGLWIKSGSNTGLMIAMVLLWLFATIMFYGMRF